MRNSILTLAIVALSFSNINAKEVTTTSNTNKSSFCQLTKLTSEELTSDQIKEVYYWNVKTTEGNYSGTSTSLEEAQKMIKLVTVGEFILDRKIESFYQVKEEVAAKSIRLYFWEATTTNGNAKGFSSSESQAKRMIELVSTGDILKYKIIESADFKQIINK